MTESSELVAVDGGEEITVSVADATAKHIELLEAKRKCESAYLEMARLIYEISENKLFAAIGPGYKSFDEYVVGELDFSPRKATYLASVWWWFGVENRGSRKMLALAQDIGWSKAQTLVNVVDSTNIDKWGEIARKSSRRELKLLVKAAFRQHDEKAVNTDGREISFDKLKNDGGGDGDQSDSGDDIQPKEIIGVEPPSEEFVSLVTKERKEDDWKRFTVDLTSDMRESVELAIKSAKNVAESDHKGNVLSWICVRYLAMLDKPPIMLNDMMTKIERSTNCKIIVLQDDHIVFGDDTVEELLKVGDK